MPVSTKHLIDAVNKEVLDATNPKLDVAIANAKIYDELQSSVFSVPNESSLPPAAENTGRLIWVTSLNDYRYSDGISWVRDFNSTTHNVTLAWALGLNLRGQLGDNSILERASPASIVGGFTDWCQVAAGKDHSGGVRSNGTIWTWGSNWAGQLGDNNSTSKSSPVSVVGGFTDWNKLSLGNYHSVAIRTNGTLWAWGNNNVGQLGILDTSSFQSSPISVPGGFTDWCQVSAGTGNTLAVRTNGTLWAWGCNRFGKLGINSTTDVSSPISVVGGFTDWCQVSAGRDHTSAVRTNGTIWSWGYNFGGGLGDNTSVSKSSPVSVVGGFTNWCQVAAGAGHTVALRTNGTLWAWGYNWAGQLGNNSGVSASSPVSVVGGFTDWCQVTAGNYHNSAIRTNGTLWTWGYNNNGQLGLGYPDVSTSSPVSVVGGISSWASVSSGYAHTLAITRKSVGF